MSREGLASTVSLVLDQFQRVDPKPPITVHSPAIPQSKCWIKMLSHRPLWSSTRRRPGAPDLRVDELPKVRLEALVRPLLIRTHQARVPRHVGG
jgi:hypothetical protein